MKEGLSAITLSWDGVGVKTAVFSPSQALVKSITPRDTNPNSMPEEMVFFHPTRGVTCLQHSPDGGFYLASGSEQGLVTLETNFDTRVIRHIASVTSIAFAPNRPLLATAQRDGLIRVWDLANAVIAAKGLSISAPSFAAISPDGKYVVSTGHSLKFARPLECAVYTTADGDAVTKQPLIPGGQIVDAQFSSDSNRLAIACSEPHEISLWNWREPKSLAKIPLPADPRGIDYGPDEQVAVLCGDATLLVIDGSTGAIQNQWKTATIGWLISPVNNGRVQFLPDGHRLVTYGHVAEVWNVATGERQFGIKHGERCHDIALSPDGTLLATADFNGKARIWDLNTGRAATTELAHPAWVYTVRFSPDGQQLLTGCADGIVRLWDWRNAQLAVSPMRHDGQVFAAEFIRDGRWIFALSDDNRFCLWDRTTGRPLMPRVLRYANQGPSNALYLTPDGKRAVLTGFPALALYDLTTFPGNLGTPEEAILRAELLSGRTIQSGSTVNLTSDEWLQRWKRYGRLVPIATASAEDRTATPKP